MLIDNVNGFLSPCLEGEGEKITQWTRSINNKGG